MRSQQNSLSLNSAPIFLPMGLELYRPAIKFLMIQRMSLPCSAGEKPVICAASASSCHSQPHIPGACLGARAEVVRSGARGLAPCQVYFRHWCSELFKMHIVCVHLTEENASSECPGLLVCQVIKSSSPAAEGSLSMGTSRSGCTQQLEARVDLWMALRANTAS